VPQKRRRLRLLRGYFISLIATCLDVIRTVRRPQAACFLRNTLLKSFSWTCELGDSSLRVGTCWLM
jgi:hypothetical protein